MTLFLRTLLITRDIAQEAVMVSTLSDRYGVSDRHVKRHIDEARQYGADLYPVRDNGVTHWECGNWHQIKDKVLTWIDLEESQTFHSDHLG